MDKHLGKRMAGSLPPELLGLGKTQCLDDEVNFKFWNKLCEVS